MGKSVKGRRPAAEDSNALAVAIASVATLVSEDGAVAKTALAKHGIPRAQAARALEELTASGLEVAGKYIRVPLTKQLTAQLAAAGMLPLRSIDSYVRGASKREATVVAGELVESKRARFVVRSTELVLAPADAPALDDRDLDRLETAIATLTAALKLARRKGGTLLRGDIDEALRPVLRAPATAATRGVRAADVHTTIDKHRESSGLTWVPKLVRALGGMASRDAVHAELLRGARAGELELRPESGMGRLSEEDAALCLTGPQGSRLSWVRRIEEKP